MCEVIVLFDGYSTKLEDGNMQANCTCTLIKGPKNIIVDTMTAWDKKKIITALSHQNIKPDDMDYVVCTHSHADHIGNNNLFTNAEHIIGSCVHKRDMFYGINVKNEEYNICPGVKIVSTPGHTPDDVTVLVETVIDEIPTRFAITGDLFEKEEDIEDPSIWQALGTRELQHVQNRMRYHVVTFADFVIPGHGPMFRVTDDMKQMIESQLIESRKSKKAAKQKTKESTVNIQL